MSNRGIPDWDKKLELFQALLDVGNEKQLVTKALHGTQYEKDIQYVADELLRKWRTSKPTQELSRFLFERLSTLLPTKDRVIGQLLIKYSVTEYVEHLPKDDEKIINILRHLVS